MTTQYNSGRTSGSFLPILFALILGVAGVIVFMRHATTGIPARLAAWIVPRSTVVDTSVPVIVQRIQRLARLETVVYSTDTVVEGASTSPALSILPDALAADRILLVVHGQSIAGIDLSQLKPEDVKITSAPGGSRSIVVTLPPSQLFVTTLDNQHTRVYARETGLLVPADRDLESNTRSKAQDQLQKAALSDGILDAASKNARATVTTLLYGLGFQQVTVN
jgi:hypothetical protein